MPSQPSAWIRASFGWLSVCGLTATASSQCATQWRAGFGLAGVDGTAMVATTWDPDGAGGLPPRLVVGGAFEISGDQLAGSLAMWDPVTGLWTGLQSPVGLVSALATLSNGSLVVAGHGVATWNGSAWQVLASQSPVAPVAALAVRPNGELIVGGLFTSIGGIAAANVARWDGQSWSALGAGTDAAVAALTVAANGDVLAAGDFTFAGGVQARGVARWNGAVWSPLGLGVGPKARCLAWATNGDLVVGGALSNAGGSPVLNVARWDGSNWSAMGGGLWHEVAALLVRSSGDVIALPSSAPTQLQRWDGAMWTAFASPLGTGPLESRAQNLTMMPAGDVVAVGGFRTAGTSVLSGVGRWDGTAWRALGPARNGVSDEVSALLPLPDGRLAVGGFFRSAGPTASALVAAWDGATWSPMGQGLYDAVLSLAQAPNGDLYSSGWSLPHVHRWNGSSWEPLGTGTDSPVTALAVLPNGDVVAGGPFHTAGGVATSGVARWDDSAWHAMGSGFSGPPAEMVVLGTDLIASGVSPVVGGAALNGIARWDGVQWSPLGTGLNHSGHPSLLVLPNGELLVGGAFTVAGGVPAAHLAVWNGASWSAFAGGTPSPVTAMALLPDGSVAVATCDSTSQLSEILRWDGMAWTSFGAPFRGYVLVMHAMANGDLAVGGIFASTGNTAASRFAVVTTTCPATVQPYGSGCSGAGGVVGLSAVALPWEGSTFRSRVVGMPPNSIALSALGFSSSAVPLAQLLPEGLPGCLLLATPDRIDLALGLGGAVDIAIPVIATPSLLGVPVFHQVVAAEHDAAWNLTGLSSSNGLVLMVGRW